MFNKAFFPKLAVMACAIMASSCPDQFIESATAALSDTCEITEYRFTNYGNTGALALGDGKGGSPENPALITISYWTDIPDDENIQITYTGASCTADGPWAEENGTFVRTYTVTAENGAKKYYRVTAVPSWDIHNAAEWQAALTFISGQPDGTSGDPAVFSLNIAGDFEVPGITTNTGTITGEYKEIRLTGTGTIRLSSNGSLIRTAANQSFIIDGVTLQGKADNPAALVYMTSSDSAVELRGGEIKDNKTDGSTGNGGGVYVEHGTFTMSGGTISGNTALLGGGVRVDNDGTFTMTGGILEYNTATYISGISSGFGGGVFINSQAGSFDMSGGSINNNTAGFGAGGGVCVIRGTFIMSKGKISGNTASNGGIYGGGGVLVDGTFTMTGGAIMENISNNGQGGGVFVGHNNGATFTMDGGTIGKNTTNGYGGGVFVDKMNSDAGTFRMNDGTISGNSAALGGGGVSTIGIFEMKAGTISENGSNNNGGGVHVGSSTANGTFTMEDGTISGNSAALGGGVFVFLSSTGTYKGTFTMNGGTISKNGSTSNGGGVFVDGNSNVGFGNFTMNNGVISGNTATNYGGGVYDSGEFKMIGGIIYGADAYTLLKNIANSGSAAIYHNSKGSSGSTYTNTQNNTVSKP
jgi:hypothetical protein